MKLIVSLGLFDEFLEFNLADLQLPLDEHRTAIHLKIMTGAWS